MKEHIYRTYDLWRYKRILSMKSCRKKEFFDVGGCGLEIEVAVNYEYRCRKYIATGLQKLKEVLGAFGKFVTDRTIGSDLNVEMVLVPLETCKLRPLFLAIREIVEYYDNFSFDENCGVHANFRADDALKRCFYEVLLENYDSGRMRHGKYKTDFVPAVFRPEGVRSYDEYLDYQRRVSGKYAGVNFLKERLVEIRTLDMSWDNIEYVIELYDMAKELAAAAGKAV